MADFKEETTSMECGPCLFDGDSVKPTYFCVDCLEYLCTECIREHRRNKSLREHKILEENELPNDVTIFEEMKKLSQCQLHPSVELDQYCPNHDALICPYCLQKDHVQCQDLKGLTRLVGKKNTTANPYELFLGIQTKCQSKRTDLINISKTAEKNKHEVEQQLHRFTNNLRTSIDNIEKTLNEKLNSLLTPLTQSIEYAENAISNIESKASLYENLLAVTSKCGTIKQNTVMRFMLCALLENFKTDTSIELNEATNFKFTYSFSPGDMDSLLRQCDIIPVSTERNASDLSSDEVLDDGPLKCIKAKTRDAATQVDTKAMERANAAKHAKNDLKDLKVSYESVRILKCECLQTDRNLLPVIAIEILTDGIILLLHEYTIKLYSVRLTLISKFQLLNKVNDMCIVSENREGGFLLAVCFEQLRKIKCIEYTGQFRENCDVTCSQSVISICMYFHHLAVLLASGRIQLIDIPTGHVCYSYEEFMNTSDESFMKLSSPKRICSYTTKRHKLILVDETRIYCLNISGSSCKEDTSYLVCPCEQYYPENFEPVGRPIINRKNSTFEDVKCDSQGNIYFVREFDICQSTVSSCSTPSTRCLLPNVKRVSSFAIDEYHNRIVVGYMFQASAHVFVYNCPTNA